MGLELLSVSISIILLAFFIVLQFLKSLKPNRGIAVKTVAKFCVIKLEKTIVLHFKELAVPSILVSQIVNFVFNTFYAVE